MSIEDEQLWTEWSDAMLAADAGSEDILQKFLAGMELHRTADLNRLGTFLWYLVIDALHVSYYDRPPTLGAIHEAVYALLPQVVKYAGMDSVVIEHALRHPFGLVDFINQNSPRQFVLATSAFLLTRWHPYVAQTLDAKRVDRSWLAKDDPWVTP